MKMVIDRFEGNYAVCEDEERIMHNINRDLLPEGAKEGTVISIVGDSIEICDSETEKRKKEIDDLMEGLWE